MADSTAFTAGDISGASGAATSSATGSPPAATGTSATTGAPTTGALGSAESTPELPVGPIPLDRHKAILEKARGETDAVRKQYEWVGARKREDVERLERWYETATRDPFRFYEGIRQMLETHPRYAPEFVKRYGRPGNGASAEADVDIPPDYQGPNGEPVYSQQAMLKREERLRTKILAEVDQRMSPKLASVEDLQQQVTQTRMEQRAQETVKALLEEAKTWEGFAELQESIKKRMATDRRLSLETAYNRAFREEYLPKYRDRIKQETMDGLNQKAHATTERASGAAVAVADDRKGAFTGDFLKKFMPKG